ncbi:hypothetical protein D1007_33173 [Hordeum vulgare]|nr:hypothetical protein D1007_33173 [Hordeum vulgare]
MNGRADIPFTLSYARDPAVVAADANPSVGSCGFASIGVPQTTGLTHDLFMAPRTTLAAGGIAPAPAVKLHVPFSKLPNTAVAKKGKVFGKNKKAVDGSSRRPKKRLVERAKDAAASEAPASSLAASAADAHNVFDEMPPR